MNLSQFSQLGRDMLYAFSDLVNVLSTPLNQLSSMYVDNKWLRAIIDFISFSNPAYHLFGDYSILQIMFTLGVGFFVVCLVVKWIIGIFT